MDVGDVEDMNQKPSERVQSANLFISVLIPTTSTDPHLMDRLG
jgi:hypothetical protein